MVISHLSDKIWYISDCGDNNGDEYGKAIIGNSCGCGCEGMIVVVLVLGTLDISDNDIYSCSEVMEVIIIVVQNNNDDGLDNGSVDDIQ